MVYGVYAVRDNKTCFTQMWYDFNDESAKRGFGFMMKNQDSIMNYAASDYDLFKIGTFDNDNGQFTPIWPIEYMLNGRATVERNDVDEE